MQIHVVKPGDLVVFDNPENPFNYPTISKVTEMFLPEGTRQVFVMR